MKLSETAKSQINALPINAYLVGKQFVFFKIPRATLCFTRTEFKRALVRGKQMLRGHKASEREKGGREKAG